MAKVISFILMLAMVVQVIRPIGIYGLRRRGDFWKIAVFALVVLTLIVLFRPE